MPKMCCFSNADQSNHVRKGFQNISWTPGVSFHLQWLQIWKTKSKMQFKVE